MLPNYMFICIFISWRSTTVCQIGKIDCGKAAPALHAQTLLRMRSLQQQQESRIEVFVQQELRLIAQQ